MRGNPVLVRAFGDEPVRAVYWDAVPGSVGICNPDLYVGWTERQDNPRPIGFPEACVFLFDESLLEQLMVAYAKHDANRLSALWEKARSFK
jgi:hypothetical protein